MNAEMTPAELRKKIRTGEHTGNTSGFCPGYVQCNMVILPKDWANEFLQFCQKNPKPCPVLGMSDPGSWEIPELAANLDIRSDIPSYKIFENGEVVNEVTDVSEYWRDNLVTFMLGCSFSFEEPLIADGLEVRNVTEECNVPMYRTNVKCREAGMYRGNMVVSMRPFHKDDVARVIEITDKYTQAHGGPVHCGDPSYLGIAEINKPDYGEKVDVLEDEVCCFWACGVTGIEGVIQSGLGGISHMPGGMFVTDVEM